MSLDQSMIEALLGTMEDMESLSPNVKGCFYGPSGVGKTVATMQLAQAITDPGREIAFVDAVEGWVSLKNHPGLTARTKRFKYAGLSQLEALVDAIESGVEPFNKIQTVVIDEFSTVARLDVDTVQKKRALANPGGKDIDKTTLPDMGVSTDRMRRVTTKLLQHDFNFLFVSHVRIDKDDATGVMHRSPDFMPKFSKSLKENLHLLGYFQNTESTGTDGEVEYNRYVQVHPTRTIDAKSRIGGLSVHVDIPTLISAIVEWKQGNRATEDSAVVHEDEPVGKQLQESDESSSDESSDEFAGGLIQ